MDEQELPNKMQVLNEILEEVKARTDETGGI